MGLFTRVADDSPSDLAECVDASVQNAKKHLDKDLEREAFDVIPSQLDIVKANDPRSHLKAKLKSLLAKYNGCTQHNEVIDIVNKLSEMNPVGKKCAQDALFAGDYCTITAPTFPGRIKSKNNEQDDVVKYTLGRISFNIFQPNKLICTLRSVRNPVHPRAELTKDGRKTFSYHFVLDITIHTPDGDLPATMINEAHCYENPDVNNRLMVTFTGCTLMPANELANNTTKLKLWESTFEGAYKKADEERSYLGWIFQYFLKLLLGLTLPSDNNPGNSKDILKNTFHFSMKRCPTGHFDLLYLDEDLRITKGNRGTIVVAERTWSDMPRQ
jgi:hypothetical protein